MIEAIVAFTRIRFPEADAEVVRKTLEPTTREGRRHWRADAPKRKSKPQVNELPAWADALSRDEGADTSGGRS